MTYLILLRVMCWWLALALPAEVMEGDPPWPESEVRRERKALAEVDVSILIEIPVAIEAERSDRVGGGESGEIRHNDEGEKRSSLSVFAGRGAH